MCVLSWKLALISTGQWHSDICVSVYYILSHNPSFFSSLDFIFPLCWAWIRWSCYHLKETTEEVEGLSGINLKWQNWMIFLKRKKNFIPILPAFCLLICWMMTTLHSTQVHKWTMVMSTTRSCSHSSWYYFCACQGNSHVRDCVMTLRDTEVHSCC